MFSPYTDVTAMHSFLSVVNFTLPHVCFWGFFKPVMAILQHSFGFSLKILEFSSYAFLLQCASGIAEQLS